MSFKPFNNPDSDSDGFNDSIEMKIQQTPMMNRTNLFNNFVHFGEIDTFQGADDLDLNGEIIYAINCFDVDHGLQGIRSIIIRDVEFIAVRTLEIEGYSTTSDTEAAQVMHLQMDFLPTMKSSMNSTKRTRCCGAPSDVYSFSVTRDGYKYKYYGVKMNLVRLKKNMGHRVLKEKSRSTMWRQMD